MLSLESSMARMSNLARQEIFYDRLHGMDEITAHIEAVTSEEVQQVAQEFLCRERGGDDPGKPERNEADGANRCSARRRLSDRNTKRKPCLRVSLFLCLHVPL